MENIRVDELLNEVYTSLVLMANEAVIQLVLDIHSTDIYIYADRNKIKQVLFNLCSNALKFTLKGFITLRVQLLMESGNELALIEIIDTGTGISPETCKSCLLHLE